VVFTGCGSVRSRPDYPSRLSLGDYVPSIDIPATAPTTTQELAVLRSDLCESLRQVAKGVMKREFELMNETHDAAELFGAVRKAAEELCAAAATWARMSDSMRDSWLP
jgi:hypothetical protein